MAQTPMAAANTMTPDPATRHRPDGRGLMRSSLRPYYLMSAMIALLLAATAAAGLLIQGIYEPFLSPRLINANYVQDTVSLLAAPILLAAMYFTGRGSARALALWLGLLVYVVYYYAFYVFDNVYNSLYPAYLALEGLGIYCLAGMLASADLRAFHERVGEGMPVKYIVAVLATALLFVPIWAGMLAADMAARQPRETALVFVLDLCFLLPAVGFTVVRLWRRHPLGYLLAGVLLFKSAISGILLTVMTLRDLQMGGSPAMEELGMYLFLAVAGSSAVALYMRNVDGPMAEGGQGVKAPRRRTI